MSDNYIKIKIGDDLYGITSDPRNWTLKKVRVNQDSGEIYAGESIGHYSNFGSLFSALKEYVVKTSQYETLSDLKKLYRETTNEIIDLIKEEGLDKAKTNEEIMEALEDA